MLLFFFFIYVFVVLAVALLLIFLSIQMGHFNKTYQSKEKLSPYECGFIPYDDSRERFEIQFYVVALLFVMLDVEIVLLLPWVLNFTFVTNYSFFVVLLFFLILGVSFAYEWKCGALDWNYY